ncbi:hypothetical protein KUCAC02_033975 [Chaenocephalus aceratus]|nr:hypothetical protein KUCAC02_033975 [Chaenocephalus aceratus]
MASEEEEDGLSPLVFVTFLCQPAVGVSLQAAVSETHSRIQQLQSLSSGSNGCCQQKQGQHAGATPGLLTSEYFISARVQATLCHVCRRNEKENIFSKVKDVWARPAITAGLYIAQERLGVMPAGTRCRKAARKGGRRPRRVVVGQTPETRRTERRD